ncbi:MAG: hypothetical protein AB1449_06755 [Chloroflexota bacterium]
MAIVRGETPMVGKEPEDTVFAFPVVALLELLVTLGTGLLVLLLSVLRNAPLEELANPAVTTDPAKAPWYFVGLQELLEHMHPTLAGVVVPGLLVTFLILLPYVDAGRSGTARWFDGRLGRRITLLTGLYTLVVIPGLMVLDDSFRVREFLRGQARDWVAQWLIPALALTIAVLLPALLLRRWRPTTREVMLVLFAVMIVSAFVLTVTGFLFRGPGFRLYWPWQMPDGYNPFDGL